MSLPVSLPFLVLHGHVARENVGIFNSLLHVGMSRSVVHDETSDKFCVGVYSVLHFHDLDHVKVNRLVFFLYCQYGVDDNLRNLDDSSKSFLFSSTFHHTPERYNTNEDLTRDALPADWEVRTLIIEPLCE